jgi:hypothetical protein
MHREPKNQPSLLLLVGEPKRGKGSFSLLGCLLFLFFSKNPSAYAQEVSYQDLIMGQRALGMGGAFTAVADDPTASFYNPAGLSQLQRLQLEVSLPVYGLEYRLRRGGLQLGNQGGRADLQHLILTSIPASVGLATLFGPKDASGRPVWGAGLSILVPWQTQYRFEQNLDAGTSGQAMSVLQRWQQTLLIGPSLSRRFGSFSIGASLFYAHYGFSWLLSQSGTEGRCQGDTCRTEEAYSVLSSLNAWTGNLQARIGLLWTINPAWRIGFMGSLSSIRLFGEGTFRLQRHRLVLFQSEAQSRVIQKENIAAYNPFPWEFRLGVSFRPNERLLLSLDISAYLPQSFSILSTDQITPQEMASFLYPNRIRRNFIMNANLGAEIKLTPTIPLRFGFYTNLSAADRVIPDPQDPFRSLDPATADCGRQACLPYMNTLGATTSIGLNIGRTSVNLGFNVAYGFGYSQRINPADLQSFAWIPSDQVFVYLYLSGAVEALGFSFMELFKSMSQNPVLKKLFDGDAPASQPTTSPATSPTTSPTKTP